MKMKHVLLEMYCSLESENEKPVFCEGIGHICIHNHCKYLGTTYCPYEIAFASERGIVESLDDFIGFGGEMELENCSQEKSRELKNEWKNICKNKILEAYDEYMKREKVN